MLQTEIDGLEVAYRRAGVGPPLLLLHGFTQDSRVWRPQLERLSEHFTVIAWDAPGAGGSSDPPETFTTREWTDCIAGLLDAVGVQSAHIVGLSWGGILAQEFCRDHADRVRSLVLADTYAGWRGSLREAVIEERLQACRRDASLPPDDFVAKYLPGMFSASPPPDAREELARIMADFHPVGFRLMAASSAETDTRDVLPDIRVPALVLWGDEDSRSSMEIARQIHHAIPGARLAVISGVGHVSNLEAPIRFNAEVRGFCSSAERSAPQSDT